MVFKIGDTLQLTWNPQLLNPNGVFDGNIMVDIGISGLVFRNSYLNRQFNLLTTTNDGAENITINNAPPICSFFSTYDSICLVHISVSTSGGQSVPKGIGIWSGTMFLKIADNITQCEKWHNDNSGVVSAFSRLPSCPPNQLVASFDLQQYILEDFSSLITADTGYHNIFMNDFHPEISVCYRLTKYVRLNIRIHLCLFSYIYILYFLHELDCDMAKYFMSRLMYFHE